MVRVDLLGMETSLVERSTKAQRRNSRWLAAHPAGVAAVGAGVFGAGGLAYGTWSDVRWLSPLVGVLIGLAVGAGLGWGFSVEQRENRAKGWRRVLYVVVLAVVILVVLGMRYLRYRD